MPLPRLAMALLPLLVVAPLGAATQTLVGLADLRGLETFRVIRRNVDGSFTEVTAQGLRAGTAQVGDGTEETRAVFKPTVYAPGGSFRRSTVRNVSFQMAGGQGTIEMVSRLWGATEAPGDIFELPTQAVDPSALTTMFQQVVDGGGDGTGVAGFMIKSPVPPAQQPSFSVRFAVEVEDAVPWQIIGEEARIGLPARRVLRFRSSRRGVAELFVNQVLVLQGVPVARGHTYHFDLVGLQGGANAVLLRLTDPDDLSTQEFSLSVNG